jgi:hypothetical protein
MNLQQQISRLITRRALLGQTGAAIGSLALAALLDENLCGGESDPLQSDGALPRLHLPPRAKRVIYLFMSGGPSQLDLFDYKPKAVAMNGQELPPSVKGTQRVTLMTRDQKEFPVAGSPFQFARHGQSGQELSELLPYTAQVADDIAIIRSLHSEPINHDPAVTFIQTGAAQPGRPTIGAWLSYGLGSAKKNLPDFIVLLSGPTIGQPLLSRYWHSGFLPSKHQGVQFRSQGEPVLYLSNPPGLSADGRKEIIEGVNELNRLKHAAVGDPEIQARINSFELAYRMQSSVPELMDISQEPKAIRDLYGAEPGRASFANNCLLARRLAERGVRFIQLYHKDWDHHIDLPRKIRQLCKETDQGAAALIQDLKQRDLLKDTLVIWGGEFGRTTYCQAQLTPTNFGRDHHPRCFSIWMAGGGIKGGITLGKTDDFGYNIAEEGVHVHDFQATLLHCLGVDHTKLTYRFQGRDFRLTDVAGKVVDKLLA